jgi:hypothetical protein
MNTNEAAIRDWFQGVLMRISLLGRAAQNGLDMNSFPSDVNSIEKLRQDVAYWERNLTHCQTGLNELKDLIEVFAKSEK